MVELVAFTDRIKHPGLQFRVADLSKLGEVVRLYICVLFS